MGPGSLFVQQDHDLKPRWGVLVKNSVCPPRHPPQKLFAVFPRLALAFNPNPGGLGAWVWDCLGGGDVNGEIIKGGRGGRGGGGGGREGGEAGRGGEGGGGGGGGGRGGS